MQEGASHIKKYSSSESIESNVQQQKDYQDLRCSESQKMIHIKDKFDDCIYVYNYFY